MPDLTVNDLNYSDLQRKLVGSVVRYEGDLCLVRQAEPLDGRSDRLYLRVLIDNGRDWTTKEITYRRPSEVVDFDTTFPEVGYFNYKGAVCYLVRKATRQWSIGYSPSSATIEDPFQRERELANSEVTVGMYDNAAFIRRVFNRTYFTYPRLLSQLRRRVRIAGALNRYVAIGRSCHFPHLVISYKNKVVGYINKDTLDPYLFSPAEYVQRVLPFDARIMEESDALALRD